MPQNVVFMLTFRQIRYRLYDQVVYKKDAQTKSPDATRVFGLFSYPKTDVNKNDAAFHK